MDILRIITGIIMFAVATSVLYVWGIKKSQNENMSLAEVLYNKGESTIVKYIKKNGVITHKDIKNLIENMKAGLFYSKRKAVVKDSEAFSKTLEKRMTEKNIICKCERGYVLNERIK